MPLGALAVVAALVAAACGSGGGQGGQADRGPAATTSVPPGGPGTPAPGPAAPTPTPAPVLVAAGDIACKPGQASTAAQCQMEATAQVVESLRPAVVAPLGDLQYERGEASGFAQSYDRSWGRFKSITRPAPGNHEYAGGKAPGYFGYFGEAAAGVGGRGWYSYDVGAWHVVALNSVCAAVGGCGPGSPQLAWLRADLESSTARCLLAYWHHPRHSSGLHGGDEAYEALWQALSEAGADVVLSGHDHHYERFAPVGGVRQFVVGTGGRSLYPVRRPLPASEAHDTSTFGVLALTLRDDGYDWRFVGVAGSSFGDEGSAACS